MFVDLPGATAVRLQAALPRADVHEHRPAHDDFSQMMRDKLTREEPSMAAA